MFGPTELTSDKDNVITVITLKAVALKIIRIGNSRGIRLPAFLLARYRIGEEVLVETRPEGLLLTAANDKRLSWDATFKAMAEEIRRSGDEFEDFENAAADGLEDLD